MSRNGKVIVAMSGGVDSSVAALLLKEQGYDCIGVFLRVGAPPPETATSQPADAATACATGCVTEHGAAPPRRLRHGCCSASDAADARAVALRLGIPFYALNFEREFDGIIEYFVDEYVRARTPNPCVQCNIDLKFGRLLRYADAAGAEFIATGHYARIVRPGGVERLARGVNRAKDQSYVLFGIPRDQLARCLFPIGEIADKAQVRRMAANLDLAVHDKPDSQEICFVPGGNYRELLARRRPESLRPGRLVTQDGRVIGEHEGVAAFTIGQRRGLGVALGAPAYVTRLDVLSNTVTLGPREALLSSGLIAGQVIWHADPPPIDAEFAVHAQIRHQHAAAPARAQLLADGRLALRFQTPQKAVTPGQAVVLYDSDVIVGGGWIDERAAAQVSTPTAEPRP
ncbi:MAG: tRNA 2-thiouridine(34) synthase MnmA [Phycisphaerae bacterium]